MIRPNRPIALDPPRMAQTIALSATSIGGLMMAANTSTAREYHAGLAVWLGIQAALAAERGYQAEERILGWMPRPQDIDIEGLDIDRADLEALQSVDVNEFKSEILSQEELFLKLAGDLPKEMVFQRELLISRL